MQPNHPKPRLASLERASEREIAEAIDVAVHADEPGLLRLPHPARLQALGWENVLRFQFDSVWSELAPMLEGTGPFEAAFARFGDHPVINEIVAASQASACTVNAGPLRIQMLFLRYLAWAGSVFEATPALSDMLHASDLGEVPASLVRAPYPIVYVGFGPDCGLSIHASDGIYPAEGAYVMEERYRASRAVTVSDSLFDALRLNEGEPLRALTFLVTGSPQGRQNALDDMGYINTLFVRANDEDRPLSQLLEEDLDLHRKLTHTHEMDLDMPEALTNDLDAAITHAAKILLYTASRQARLSTRPDRSDIERRLHRTKGGKRAKLERRLHRAYDRVVVGPEQMPAEASSADASTARGPVRPHWRRGHFHTVAHGPGRRLRRVEWFSPTLVRADRLHDEAPAAKSYRIHE